MRELALMAIGQSVKNIDLVRPTGTNHHRRWTRGTQDILVFLHLAEVASFSLSLRHPCGLTPEDD